MKDTPAIQIANRAPRIALLLPDLRGGGAERVGIELANEFSRRGFLVDMLLLQSEGELASQLDAKVRVFNLRTSRTRFALLALLSYLRRDRPAGLVANMWPLTVLAPVAAKLSGTPCRVLTVEHNAISNQYNGWGLIHRVLMRASLALGLRLADTRAGVSSGVADDVARLAKFPRDRIATLYNPVPSRLHVSEIALAHADRVWACPKGRRIISVGSLKEQKNHRLLLRAFRDMGDDKAFLLILGQGSLEAELRTLAEELGILRQVVFAGFYHDPTPFYATADLFVLSSDYEGFGNVLVEALGQGVPVVSTDCPSGPSEILAGGTYGTLVPPGDAEALAKAMGNALSIQHDRDLLRGRARHFGIDKAADAYLDTLLPGWRGQQQVSS